MRNQSIIEFRVNYSVIGLAYVGMIGIAINNRDCNQGVPGEHRLIPARYTDRKCGLVQADRVKYIPSAGMCDLF